MVNVAAAYTPIIASVLGATPAGGALEAVFAGVVAQMGVAPGAPAEFPFPANAEILAELTDDPTKWSGVIRRHIENFVLPQRAAIPATAVMGPSGGAAVAWNTREQIDKIVRNEDDVTFTEPTTNSLAEAAVARFDFKLHQLQPNPGHDIAKGWKLLKDFEDSGAVPAAAHASKPVAMLSIKRLAAFEGFCTRLASAIMAADRGKVTLAQALALWRTEGDLLVPWPEKRRLAKAPTFDVIDGIKLGNADEVFFSMKRGLWSRIATELPADAAEKTLLENKFKLDAFTDWAIVAAGTDFFWQPAQVSLDLDDRPGTVGRLAHFLNDNHKARGLTDNLAARTLDCERVLDDLACTLPAAVGERVVVAPNDPTKLLALILAEALIFSELDAVSGKGPVIAPTRKLKYLAYHCQDARHATDPAKDKFTLILVSAAVAAARGPAGPLKASLAAFAADPLFPKSKDLPDLRTRGSIIGDTTVHVGAYQKLEGAGWWTQANLDNLADFMLVATLAQWGGFAELRGNMARFAKLHAYYDALLS